MLHPSFKSFDVNPSLQGKAVNLVKSEINKRQSLTKAATSTMITATVTEVEPITQAESSKSLLSQCFDLPKNDRQVSPKPYQELDEYMNLNADIKKADDVLLF